MNKRLVFVLVAVALLASIATAARAAWLRSPSGNQTGKLQVVASFYPMAEFARQIGGDRVVVSTMVRPGVEPHDYEPAPRDLAQLYSANVFVYNGAGLEPWVNKIHANLATSNVVVVNASQDIPLRTLAPGNGEAGTDPHVWLDPVLAQQQVTAIAAALAKADPTGAPYYQKRAATYKSQLAQLDADYRAGLAHCGSRDIVTSHQAFGYLGARYGLYVMPISGLSPDEEPSPQKLSVVTKFVKDHNVHAIFFESLVSPKLSNAIAHETGATTLVFNPLEGLTTDQERAGDNYLTVQYQNLNNLKIALDCR